MPLYILRWRFKWEDSWSLVGVYSSPKKVEKAKEEFLKNCKNHDEQSSYQFETEAGKLDERW